MFEKIIIVVLIFVFLMCYYSALDEVKNRRILREHEMLMKVDISDTGIDIIDKIITEQVTKYRVMNIDHKKAPYINEEQQTEMIKKILEETLNSISPTFYEKATLIYNKDKFEDIVYNKVMMAVLAVTVEINGSYSEV